MSVADELVAIVLEDVEKPSLRRVLEHLIRNDKLQQACILKDMELFMIERLGGRSQ